MIASLERSRAATAVDRIGKHNAFKPASWGAYAKLANSLPMAIRQQGLARAVAMTVASFAKEKDPLKKLGRASVLDDLCEGILSWHTNAGTPAAFNNLTTAIASTATSDEPNAVNIQARACALIDQSIKLDFWSYTVLQRECQEILQWLKVLSEQHKPKEPAGGPGVSPSVPATADGEGAAS